VVWPGDSLPGRAERAGQPSSDRRSYEVNVRLALPNGREVNVGRTAQADERQAALSFAINDAFKHVRRRLQDHVRRVQDR